MKVLNIAYPFAPVRQDTAGGAEQVVAMLDRALTNAGHQSLVIACEGSQVYGQLLPSPNAAGCLDERVRASVHEAYREIIARAIERCQPDLVHLHGIDFLEYLPPAGIPTIATLHLPPSWYNPEIFHIQRTKTWLHCVSQSQQEACPSLPNLLPYIGNGVEEDLPYPNVHKREFALSLGRICPEKGFHFAFEAAAIAGVPFLLAGQIYAYEAHQAYYQEQIAPRTGRRSRFIGPVGLKKKRRLLTSARCMLIPSLAPETSSLVAMEAAMCGTPVIAFRSGALPEVIDDGVTGFLVNGALEMADAIRRCDRIDGAQCRKIALSRFSERRSSASYLNMYQEHIRQ